VVSAADLGKLLKACEGKDHPLAPRCRAASAAAGYRDAPLGTGRLEGVRRVRRSTRQPWWRGRELMTRDADPAKARTAAMNGLARILKVERQLDHLESVMGSTLSEPRAHHQAAQAYLQNFANKKRQVTVYDRIEKKTIPLVGIRNVAVAKDFYTTIDDGRRDLTFETKVLGRFDNDLPKLLAKLLAPHPTLTTDERVKLDVIMTLQFLRTREGRRFWRIARISTSACVSMRSSVEYLRTKSTSSSKSFMRMLATLIGH
jgi:hypothetical protein